MPEIPHEANQQTACRGFSVVPTGNGAVSPRKANRVGASASGHRAIRSSASGHQQWKLLQTRAKRHPTAGAAACAVALSQLPSHSKPPLGSRPDPPGRATPAACRISPVKISCRLMHAGVVTIVHRCCGALLSSLPGFCVRHRCHAPPQGWKIWRQGRHVTWESIRPSFYAAWRC